MAETESVRDHSPEMRTIWSAESIAQAQSAKSLLFQSRHQVFALPTEFISEVIEAPECLQVPGSPWWYRGLAIYRSRPAPIIDPVQYFVPALEKPADSHTRAIVVTVASSDYLFTAEKVLNLCQLDMTYQEVFSGDQTLIEHPAIAGTGQYDNKSVAIIDIPELLRQTRLLRELV